MAPYVCKFDGDALYLFKDGVKVCKISENALWVEDRMEFHDYQISLYLADLKHPDESILNGLESNKKFLEWANIKIKEKPHRYAIIAEIKGPCGHFH